MIKLSIIPNRQNYYHKDFLIKVGDQERFADTYYFWSDEFGDLEDPYDGIKESISEYLFHWWSAIKELPLNETIFIPIDLADEFAGGFKIKSQEDLFDIMYGYVYEINNLIIRVTESECYTNLNEKDFESIAKFSMDKNTFLNLLKLS